MNTTAIVLTIILLILIYVLIRYFTSGASTLTKTASLSSSNPAITSLSNAGSQNYAYGVWLYINSWNSGSNHVIFERPKNIKLYLDPNKPVLYCDIYTSKTNASGAQIVQTITITDNFPIQSWTYISVVVDGGLYVDSYINGKLVNSTQLSNVALQPNSSASTVPVSIGSASGVNNFDASIAGFQNWSYVIGPQDVWSAYMSGNSGGLAGSLSRMFNSYSVDVTLKNNTTKSSSTMQIL